MVNKRNDDDPTADIELEPDITTKQDRRPRSAKPAPAPAADDQVGTEFELPQELFFNPAAEPAEDFPPSGPIDLNDAPTLEVSQVKKPEPKQEAPTRAPEQTPRPPTRDRLPRQSTTPAAGVRSRVPTATPVPPAAAAEPRPRASRGDRALKISLLVVGVLVVLALTIYLVLRSNKKEIPNDTSQELHQLESMSRETLLEKALKDKDQN